MLEDIETLARKYIKYPNRATIFHILRRGTAHEVYVKYSRLIAKKKINIKWGDVICNWIGMNRPIAQWAKQYLPIAFIYNGKYLINSEKYYKGDFRIWEPHPTFWFFINSSYWFDMFNFDVFFNYKAVKLVKVPRSGIDDHAYSFVLNKETYYIDRRKFGLDKYKIQSSRFMLDRTNKHIIVLPKFTWKYFI